MNGWNDDKYEKYKATSQNIVKEVKLFFDTIDESNLVEAYENCDVTFWDDFWFFFYQFRVYERISKDRFGEVGKMPYLKEVMGMTNEDIINAIKKAISYK